jgi:hypothetical protein
MDHDVWEFFINQGIKVIIVAGILLIVGTIVGTATITWMLFR